jgi:hypothetical protein
MRTILRLSWSLALLASVHLTAGPASAECSFIPPIPRAEPAIRSAKEVVVGKLVPASAADLGVRPTQEREIALP